MKVAALDLGSNTFLLLVVEVSESGLGTVYGDFTEVTRLAQGVHAHGSFHPEALERAKVCLAKYQEIIREEQADVVVAVTTSAARSVDNLEQLLEMGNRYGIPIQMIDGKLEAELTFSGATFDRPNPKATLVVDVGGGSTEVISEKTGVSLEVGSVRLTEKFVHSHPLSQEDRKALFSHLDQVFTENKSHLPCTQGKNIVAVAGTPTTLAMMIQGLNTYEEEKIHGVLITRNELLNWFDRLCDMSIDQRRNVVGLEPKRADVIVSGLAILLKSMEHLGQERMTVSTKGVRYGVALRWRELHESAGRSPSGGVSLG
jgi:exopolyphosphatase/guanosine-5'-triphosphate,3'-diphosphate pyrophosphatase